VANADERKQIKIGAADSVKRVHLLKSEDKTDWLGDKAQGLFHIRDLIEFKTTWHPIGA
jgi:aldehyde dehydrogenase (NAD+)